MATSDDAEHSRPEPRTSGPTVVLAAAMLGLAEVLEPKPPRDLGAEVVDAPTDEPLLDLDFGPLDPLD
jgi:hypothetical protein